MSWTSDALNAAKNLTLAAGAVASISAADIDKQAVAITKNYSNLTVQQVSAKISEDIKTLRK